MNTVLHATLPFSLWLSRQLDGGKIDESFLTAWLARPLNREDFVHFADWQALIAAKNEEELTKQLRILRRYVVAHIIVRDINHISDLAEVTRTITELADFAINMASDYAEQYYRDLYGTPMGQYSDSEQHLSVIAMGKAGGFELNVSSDIDLILFSLKAVKPMANARTVIKNFSPKWDKKSLLCWTTSLLMVKFFA